MYLSSVPACYMYAFTQLLITPRDISSKPLSSTNKSTNINSGNTSTGKQDGPVLSFMLRKQRESVDVNMPYKTVPFSVQCQRRSAVYGIHHHGYTATLLHHERLWKEKRCENETMLNGKKGK